MLFGIVVAVALIGAVVLGAGLLFQRGREAVDISPRSLLRLYLYVASLAGIVVLAGGIAALVAFGLAGPLGRDVVYGSQPIVREVPCPAGADCGKAAEEQNRRALAERDRRVAEDLIRGVTFAALGAVFFVAHWSARRALKSDEGGSLLLRSYLMIGTLAFGLATITMLPGGITAAASNALLPATPDTYRQAAGEQLGGGLVALVIWLAYLRLAIRDFRRA